MSFSLDKKLDFGQAAVAASEATLPNIIGLGEYGEAAGKPVEVFALEPVSGTVTVKLYSGATDTTATTLILTSAAYGSAHINGGHVSVFVPTLPEGHKFLKVSVTGSAAGGTAQAFLGSYAGK
jgi:hypothetical protein